MKCLEKTMCVLAAVICLLMGGVSVAAESAHPVSLSLSFVADGDGISGAAFDVWKVADVAENGEIRFIADDPNLPTRLTDLSVQDEVLITQKMQQYVTANRVLPTDSGHTDEAGLLTLPKVDAAGLYLVIGSHLHYGGYDYEVSPFVVSLPGRDAAGNQLHEVTAAVKYDRVLVEPPKTTTTVPSTSGTTAGDNLPQTGTWMWLVPVLAIGGGLLLLLGILLKKSSDRHE